MPKLIRLVTLQAMLVVGLSALANCRSEGGASMLSGKGVELKDTPMDKPLTGPDVSGQRYLTNSATYQFNLPTLVGKVLFIKKRSDGSCPGANDKYDAIQLSDKSFVKKPEDFALQDKLGPPLYESKVTKGASTELRIFLFGGKASVDDVAEVALTNVSALPVPASGLRVGYASEVLSQLRPDECDVFVIMGATVKTLSAKYYRKTSASGSLSGAVFGDASGNIYKEDGISDLQFLIAIDIVPVRANPNVISSLPAEVQSRVRALPAHPSIPRIIQSPRGGIPIRRIPLVGPAQ